MRLQQVNAAITDERNEEFKQCGECNTRFVAELRDRTTAGVKIFDSLRGSSQRVVCSVITPNTVAELAVKFGAAAFLDPGVFIGRDGLRCQLTSNPIRFFGQDYIAACSGGGECSRTTSDTSANDDDIGTEFPSIGSGRLGISR
jgi:hypothetical protein